MHALITGINGYIAQYLLKYKPDNIRVSATYHSLPDPSKPDIRQIPLDLERNISEQLTAVKADVVIHAAALSNLAFCENHPDLARRINSTATEELAQWCGRNDARLIYLSTDIVFDGKNAPYVETDKPQPVNVYGKSKYQGELSVAGYSGNCIVRLALVLGRGLATNKNFVDWIIERVNNNQPLPLFCDEIRTPVTAMDAAGGLWKIIQDKRNGIIHLCSDESIDRYNLGKIIAAAYDKDFNRFEKTYCAKLDIKRPLNVSLINNIPDYNIPALMHRIKTLF